MNDFDSDRDLEADVRAELRRTIVPPATPEYLRARVEEMAEPLSTGPGRRPIVRLWIGRGALALRLAATALILVVVAATVVSMSRSSGGGVGAGSVPTNPSSNPTEVAARSGDPAGTPGPTFAPDPRDVRLQDATADGTAIVVVGENAIRVSPDGGDTWSAARPLPAGTFLGGKGSFVDGQHGWTTAVVKGSATDSLVMYRTSDGGQTWHSSPVGSLAVKPGSWVADWEFHFTDVDHGVLRTFSVNDPTVNPTPYSDCAQYITSDGGVTWSPSASHSCAGNHPTWVTNTLGYVQDVETPMDSAVTQDGGRTWTTGRLPIDASEMGWRIKLLVAEPGRLRAEIEFTPKTGADWPPRHAVYDSTDGGATWLKAYDLNVSDDIQVLGAPSFDHWFAKTNAHEGDTSALIASDDGGRTWHQVASSFVPSIESIRWWDSSRGAIQGFTCPNGGTTVSCSNYATVYITSDGGQTWRQVTF
jgi:photosystem II stability/assembly factor-like uncharacterized protein